MKREPDLSRSILLFVEEHAPASGGLDRELAIDGYDRATVYAHAQLLIDDGYIDGKVLEGLGGIFHIMIYRLTSSGHDAIEAMRNDTLWGRAKKTVLEKSIPFTLTALLQVLKAEAHNHVSF
jgi:Hypothetical protein (DUF2513)